VAPPSIEDVATGNQSTMPQTHSTYEDVAQHVGPAAPTATVASVPPNVIAVPAPPGTKHNAAPSTGTLANVGTGGKPLPEVWETNHKKHDPATSLSNIPKAAAPGVVPTGSMANVPPGASAPTGAVPLVMLNPAGAPGTAEIIVPAVVTDPKKGARKAVRWDSHLLGNDVVMPPSKTPSSAK
jgi:hypothetical protein